MSLYNIVKIQNVTYEKIKRSLYREYI